MHTDSAFWFELRDAFQPLPKDVDATPDPWRDVFALWLDDDGHYKITDDLAAKEERADGFRRLAEKAGLAVGEPDLASAADRWLDLIGAGRKLRTRNLGPLSANYCARRGNEAFAHEMAPMSDIAVPALQVEAAKAKRGRPPTIPEERKTAAAKLKANGGTNREAAMEIYGSRYPDAQQVKNVPSILRNHQRKTAVIPSPKRIKNSG